LSSIEKMFLVFLIQTNRWFPNTPSQRWEFADSRLVQSVGSSGTCSKQTRTTNNKLQLVSGSLGLHFYEDFWAQTLAALHQRLRKLLWKGSLAKARTPWWPCMILILWNLNKLLNFGTQSLNLNAASGTR
jgi:hypothetical protein